MFTPSPKPTLEEIFDNYDHLSTNPPLSDNNEILRSIHKDDDEEETNLRHVRSYLEKDDILEEEEQERVWVRAKMSISQGLVHDTETKKTKTE